MLFQSFVQINLLIENAILIILKIRDLLRIKLIPFLIENLQLTFLRIQSSCISLNLKMRHSTY